MDVPSVTLELPDDESSGHWSVFTLLKHLTMLLKYKFFSGRHFYTFIPKDTDKLIRSRMLPPFISDAKDKHPTFIFSVIRSRMLPPFISDAKDKHPTFILASYGAECYRHSFPTLKTNIRHLFLPLIRSRMLPPFISDAKDKHPTFIFSVIRSRMLPPFISYANDKHPTFIF